MSAEQTPDLSVEALYSNHHGWLQGWLRRKLGNSFDAADLAQDTFLRVLRARLAEPVRDPRAYLSTIANGLVISHWRRQALEQAWLAALAARPEPVWPSPEDRALILETLEEIALLLDQLSPRNLEIFLLSQLDGMSYPQIAQRMGVTVNVVQKAMTAAMARCYAVLYADR